MLNIQNLYKQFGSLVAVNNLSLTVAPGRLLSSWGRQDVVSQQPSGQLTA